MGKTNMFSTKNNKIIPNTTMKKNFLFLSALFSGFLAMAQWDGDVFTDGCQAINQNDYRIISWAKGVEVYRGTQYINDSNPATYGNSYDAQGMPDSTVYKCISLGEGGTALITFDRPIYNGEGKDFVVFENAFNSSFLELAFVEVSSDGVNFFRFPAQTTSSDDAEGRQSTHYNNLAGKYELGWGVGFDLDDIEDNENLNKNNIRLVRLVDVVNGVDVDALGNIIYDGDNGSSTYSAGFDLAGVGIINGGSPYKIADFEDGGYLANANSYDLATAENYTDIEEVDGANRYYKNYVSNGLVFPGVAYESYGYMMSIAFGPSNITDASTATGNGYGGAYYTAAAAYALEGEGNTYMQAYYDEYSAGMSGNELKHNNVYLQNDSTFFPMGVYVCQSLASYNYVATAANQTDGFVSVVATGYDAEGNLLNTVSKRIVDWADNQIGNRKEWAWMDLADLGEVKEIVFTLASNYSNAWGLEVPAYFCLDNFVYQTDTTFRPTSSLAETNEASSLKIYPNPATTYTILQTSVEKAVAQVFDMQGRLILTEKVLNGYAQINTADLHGTYFVRIVSDQKTETKKLIVK